MREVLAYIVIAGDILLLLPVSYLLLLTLAGLFYRWSRTATSAPSSRFAVLVPAHNEEKLLPLLLESIRKTGYPEHLLDVFVVADNCTDGTAKSVGDYPCMVFERQNDELIGKGYALEWLLEQIQERSAEFDAYVFLDSDCEITPNFFSVMDTRFRRGDRAVQAYYTTANPTETWVSSLRHLALILMHHTRPGGREVLGLSCGIFGTGMALHREVVERFGWQTHGLAEDVEYFMQLVENGIRVSYAREAEVLSAMPSTLRASRTQNERWEKGRLSVAKRYFAPFVIGGLLGRSAMKVDAGLQQTIPPLSLVGLGSLVMLAVSVLVDNALAMVLGIAVAGGLTLHGAVGVLAARPPLKVLFSVAYVPWYVAWKLALYARSLKSGKQEWVRTERPD